MQRNFLLTILIALLSFLSCNKIEDDLQGDGRLAGRLMYRNEYSGNPLALPLSSKKVFIAYSPSDNLNYIYSSTTDSDGYFRFTNLDKYRQYDIFFADSINDIRFTVSVTRTPDNDTVLLMAVPDIAVQNGITVLVTDSNGNHTQSVPVSAYDNYDIYKADSSSGATTNSIHTFNTNQFGRDNWFNIGPAKYYLIARKESGSVLLTAYGSCKVEDHGIVPVTIQLAGPKVYGKNGMLIKAEDEFGNRLENAKCLIYDKYQLYRTDSLTKRTDGATQTISTNSSGTASWLNIIPGKYYVIVSKEDSGIMKIGYGFATVDSEGIAETTILLIHFAEPIVRIKVKDGFGTPVNSSDVYFYTSKSVADLDSGYNSFDYKISSNSYGIAIGQNINAATYFLKAVKHVADTTLTGVGLVNVRAEGISDTLIVIQ